MNDVPRLSHTSGRARPVSTDSCTSSCAGRHGLECTVYGRYSTPGTDWQCRAVDWRPGRGCRSVGSQLSSRAARIHGRPVGGAGAWRRARRNISTGRLAVPVCSTVVPVPAASWRSTSRRRELKVIVVFPQNSLQLCVCVHVRVCIYIYFSDMDIQ